MLRKKPAVEQTPVEIARPEPRVDEVLASPDSETSDTANVEASGDELRRAQIRDAAYAAYERRGNLPGTPLDDWLEAERAVGTGHTGKEDDAAPV